jgi:PKD repeat protein
MGDGNNLIEAVDIIHTYNVAGVYTVTLTVQDSGGMTNTAETVVTIQDVAPADGRPVRDDGRNR